MLVQCLAGQARPKRRTEREGHTGFLKLFFWGEKARLSKSLKEFCLPGRTIKKITKVRLT